MAYDLHLVSFASCALGAQGYWHIATRIEERAGGCLTGRR